MRNIWIWFVVVIALILGGVFWLSSSTTANNGANGTGILLAADAIDANDWKEGSTTAKVQLVEYGDFQCPACSAYFPLVEQVNAEYADRIQFVFKNYPLAPLPHPNALVSAYAAEAAGKQGKFFDMYRILYTKQNDWAEKTNDEAKAIFVTYAQTLGLNIEQFKKDADSTEVKNKVDHDKVTGNQSGVAGTPTFYLNGQQIANPQSFDAFKAVIDQALNESK